MQKNGVKIMDVVVLILLALVLAVIAWRQENWAMAIRIILMIGSIFFLAMAIVAAVIWIEYRLAAVEEVRTRSAAYSERVRFAMELRWLTPEQIAAMSRYVPAYEVISGDTSTIFMWRCVAGGLIDRNFIRRYIEAGTEKDLPAVRTLPDAERVQAMDFITDAAARGWVHLPAGNRPATWRNRADCLQRIWGVES